MEKFSRNYRLIMDGFGDKAIEIRPPFTLEFDIQRTIQATVNVVNLRIFNLSPKTREILRKDGFDYHDIRHLTLQMGYGDKLYTVASGNVRSASSVRQGSDFITTIVAQDGGQAFNTSHYEESFAKGTGYITIVESLIKSLADKGIKKGAIGNVPGKLSRGNPINGNTVELLNEYSNGGFYIDNGRAYIIHSDEALEANEIVISAETGMIGTPTREQSYIKVQTLFTPEIQLNQTVGLKSETGRSFTGQPKVYAISHAGIISESKGGVATTSLTLLDGNYLRVRRLEGGL